jgi:hypothetical protein
MDLALGFVVASMDHCQGWIHESTFRFFVCRRESPIFAFADP